MHKTIGVLAIVAILFLARLTGSGRGDDDIGVFSPTECHNAKRSACRYG